MHLSSDLKIHLCDRVIAACYPDFNKEIYIELLAVIINRFRSATGSPVTTFLYRGEYYCPFNLSNTKMDVATINDEMAFNTGLLGLLEQKNLLTAVLQQSVIILKLVYPSAVIQKIFVLYFQMLF